MLEHRFAADSKHIKKWILDNFPAKKGILLMIEGKYALKQIRSSVSKRVKIKVLNKNKKNRPEMIKIRVEKGEELILFDSSDIKAAIYYLEGQIWYYNNFE